jgi:RNA polymerase sigma-70 factor (ECF subfamily)
VTGDFDEERRELKALFKAYAPRLHSVALRETVNRATAESLVQDVFEDAWKQRETLFMLEDDEQRSWLFSVLHNKIMDMFRLGAGKFERLVNDPDYSMDQRSARRSSTPRTALLRDVLDRCWDVIKGMPEVRRKVFFLRAEEWTTREIAEELGIAQSTVRSHLQRGLEQFEEKIGASAEIFIDLEDESVDGTPR